MNGDAELFWIGDGPDLRPPADPGRGITWLVVALVVTALLLAALTA